MNWFRRRPAAALILVISVPVVLLAACAKQSSSQSSGAKLTIQSPTDGASVASPVKLALSMPGVQIGKPETGDKHFHVHIDGSSDYSILYSTSGEVNVPKGKHTIEVVLAEPNHTETSTTASVSVNVTGGTSSGTGGGRYGSGSGSGYGSGGGYGS